MILIVLMCLCVFLMMISVYLNNSVMTIYWGIGAILESIFLLFSILYEKRGKRE